MISTKIHRPSLCKIVIFLAILFTIIHSQSTPIQALTLSEPFNTTQSGNTYKYYQLTFNVTSNILQITIDEESNIFVGLYLSVHPTGSNEAYYTHPNETYNTQECYQSSFDTCVIRLDKYTKQSEITIYFSVRAYDQVTYGIFAAQDDFYNVNISTKYNVYFEQFSSGILKVSGQQLVGKEQVVMVMTYNTSGIVGKFKVKVAVDQVPNGYSLISGVSVGAFNKIVKLQPIQNTSDYYILIEGEKNTRFTLQFDQISLSAPNIQVNSSLIYYTRNNISYHTISRFENVDLPLFIRLDAYLGYGVFYIEYCGGLMQTTFQNLNGENGQIAITPFERMNCKTKMMSNSFGLLAQNLQISVLNVNYEFGYQIGVYEGNYTTIMHINEEIFGLFLYFQESRVYELQVPASEKNPLYLSYTQLTQTNGSFLTFQIEQCQKKRLRDKCKTVSSSDNVSYGELIFTPKANMSYNAKISYPSSSNNTNTLEYMLQFYSQTKSSQILLPSKMYIQEIQQKQFQFYEINLTQVHEQQRIIIKNLSQLTIHIKQLNGEVAMLTSLTIPQPTNQKNQQKDSDIIYSWSGSTTYLVNQTTEMIYIGVKGYEQSLYSLHYTINVDADIPAKYTKIVDGTQNNFILNAKNKYQLISFASHAIPYKVFVTGSPLCIKFGHSLPLNQTCASSLPTEFSEKVVYLNISNGDVSNSSFKFSVFINSGTYVLDEKDPILIGCTNPCFEIVRVMLKESSNIIHQGRGNITDLSNPSQGAMNNYLNLSCSAYPCIVKINASLHYGGQMNLFLQSSGIQQIGWMGRPITFGTYPKRFIFQIKKWSSINSILIYSEAMQLNVYYNVIDINEEKTNILTYDFPTQTKYQATCQGNPLRNIHTINIDESILQKKNCRGIDSFCMVTLSLYPNLSIQYNENYRKQGIGFISSNIYQYFVGVNIPLRFSGKFSMSYFTYQYDSKVPDLDYRVNIEPLSNCHPKLFTGQNYSNPNFEDPSYDDSIVSPINKWVNYSVLVEKPCNYMITLTNTPFETVIQDKYYFLQPQNAQITVIYRSEYSSTSQFSIEVDTGSIFTKVDYILVKKIDNNNVSIPTIKDNTFIAINKSSLTVSQTSSYNLYLITIMTKALAIKLLVKKGGPIILSHNQEHMHTIQANSILNYRIYSTGSIALFLTTNSQRPVVTINKHYNGTNVLTTYLTDRSSPWIYINATNNDIQTYDITVNNDASSPININIMFEQNDSLAFKKIYQGIIAYDAFVSKQEMNCYTYESPMLLGRKDITIDFVIGKNQVIDFIDCQLTNSCFKLSYKATAKDTIVKSSIQLLKSNSTAYRIKVDFVPRQNYTFCFHTPTSSVLNTQYYILLNDPQMEHLLEDYTLTQSYESVYDMYEIVEEGLNQNIMIEVTSCSPSQKNERIIVGSSNFEDSENGRFTDLDNYYKNADSIFAKLSVQEGYYYLGVKNNIYLNEFLNIYTIRFQNLGINQNLLGNTWHLKQRKIVKIYLKSKLEKVTIEVPEVMSSLNDNSQKNITITYTVHIMGMKNSEDFSRVPLSILARCPNYHEAKMNEGPSAKKDTNSSVNIIKKSLTFNYDSLLTYQNRKSAPIFEFDVSQIPKRVNVTGRIDLNIDSQVFSYYYDTTYTSFDPTDEQDSSGAFAFLIFMLVITGIVMIVVAAIVCYRRYKKNVNAKNVAFEMANFNQTGENPTARREQRQSLTTPAGSRVKGYGEFVDEIA